MSATAHPPPRPSGVYARRERRPHTVHGRYTTRTVSPPASVGPSPKHNEHPLATRSSPHTPMSSPHQREARWTGAGALSRDRAIPQLCATGVLRTAAFAPWASVDWRNQALSLPPRTPGLPRGVECSPARSPGPGLLEKCTVFLFLFLDTRVRERTAQSTRAPRYPDR